MPDKGHEDVGNVLFIYFYLVSGYMVCSLVKKKINELNTCILLNFNKMYILRKVAKETICVLYSVIW